MWKGIEKFEYDPEKCRFRTWLGTVCRNCVYNYFESQKKHNRVHADGEVPNTASSQADIEAIIDNEWKVYIAKLAFEKISERFQPNILEAYERFQNGENLTAIAADLDVAENTVYVYNKRVKDAMTREILLLINDLE